MNKPPASDTLRELWMIKCATAQRFRTTAAQFEHLGLQSPAPHNMAKAAKPKKPAAGWASPK